MDDGLLKAGQRPLPVVSLEKSARTLARARQSRATVGTEPSAAGCAPVVAGSGGAVKEDRT
jgi:hypothetical protein